MSNSQSIDGSVVVLLKITSSMLIHIHNEVVQLQNVFHISNILTWKAPLVNFISRTKLRMNFCGNHFGFAFVIVSCLLHMYKAVSFYFESIGRISKINSDGKSRQQGLMIELTRRRSFFSLFIYF